MEKVLINVKEYELESFFNKDLVSVDELIQTIDELEHELRELKKEKEENEPDEFDAWQDYKMEKEYE